MQFERYDVEFKRYEKEWVKHANRWMAFIIGAFLFFLLIWWLGPKAEAAAKIQLSEMQRAYGFLSVVIAAALYVWGVGNWSRFEPPKEPQDSANRPFDSGITPLASPGGTPLTPLPVKPAAPAPAAPGAPPAGAPAAPKGDH